MPMLLYSIKLLLICSTDALYEYVYGIAKMKYVKTYMLYVSRK